MSEIGDFLDELEAPLKLAKPNKIKVKMSNVFKLGFKTQNSREMSGHA